MVYFLVLLAVASMTTGHLLLKKGLLSIGQFPQNLGEMGPFILKMCTSPYFIGSAALVVVTALSWIFAVSRQQLSFLYPFMALSFVFVALFSWILFKEDVSVLRWLGIVVICIGVFLVSRS